MKILSEFCKKNFIAVLFVLSTVQISNAQVTLNLKMFIEGYYLDSNLMRPVLYSFAFEFGNPLPDSTYCDSITVQLLNPDTHNPIETAIGILHTDGTASISFPGIVSGSSYYIAVRTRNTLQTWSASPVTMTSYTLYDFTTSADKAYCNKMKEIVPGIWAFYSGDINQDREINPFDSVLWDSDNQMGLFGYYASDLNGDIAVDVSDYLVFEQNIFNDINQFLPCDIDDGNPCTIDGINPLTGVFHTNTLTIGNDSIENISCNSGGTGSIFISLSGGIQPYSFLWSNGATTKNITEVSVGNYSVIAIDANGCSTSLIESINYTSPPPLALCKNISVQLDFTGNATISPAIVDSGSTAICGIAAMNVTPNTFTLADTGNVLISLTVIDSSGRTSTCDATAMVVPFISKKCGFDIVQSYLFNDSNYAALFDASQANETFHIQTDLIPTADYLIPVVVHVIYKSSDSYGNGSNISYTQIQSQINALNAAFANDYVNYNQQVSGPNAQNSNIRFCLAENTTPSGLPWANMNSECGVMRYEVADNDSVNNYIVRLNDTIDNARLNRESNNHLLNITHSIYKTPGSPPTTWEFPFDKYLNIWVVDSVIGAEAVGFMPPLSLSPLRIDGVIIGKRIFGDNTSVGPVFPLFKGLEEGKVLAHEVGHYLTLFHTFTDPIYVGRGGCGTIEDGPGGMSPCDICGDKCCDTPPSIYFNKECNTVQNTVHETYNIPDLNDQLENYMSYSDDGCMNTFTYDQVTRMHTILGNPVGPNHGEDPNRYNLWQPANLIATGVVNNINYFKCNCCELIADFKLDKQIICPNEYVNFFTPTGPGFCATYWQWSFPGGNPSSYVSVYSNNQNPPQSQNPPPIRYASSGKYTVTLTASNGIGGPSVTKQSTVAVGSTNIIGQSNSQNEPVCDGSLQFIEIEFADNSSNPEFSVTIEDNLGVQLTIPHIKSNPARLYFNVHTGHTTYKIVASGICSNENNIGIATFNVVPCCDEKVKNGDFESGTECDMLPSYHPDLSICGAFGIGSDSYYIYDGAHNDIGGFPKTQNKMLVDAPDVLHQGTFNEIWCQDISFTTGAAYQFQFFVGGYLLLHLQWFIDGQPMNLAPIVTPDWNIAWSIATFNWVCSLSSGTHKVCICQVVATNGLGYDFFLDNISIKKIPSLSMDACCEPTLTKSISSEALCHGDCFADFSVNASGGIPCLAPSSPYSYELTWPDNHTTNNNSYANMCGGLYKMKVTDCVGCVTYEKINLKEPPLLELHASITNSQCQGSSSINVNATGGVQDSTIQFTEDMGIPEKDESLLLYNRWHNRNNSIHFSSSTTRALINFTTQIGQFNNGYVLFPVKPVYNDFIISGISTLHCSNPMLSFKAKRLIGNQADILTIEISTDGNLYTILKVIELSTNNTWENVYINADIPITSNLRIRFSKRSQKASFEIDDVKITDYCTNYKIISGPTCFNNNIYPFSNSNTHYNIFEGLCEGTYTLAVTDCNGCTKTITVNISPQPYAQPRLTTIVTQLSACTQNLCSGSIRAYGCCGTPINPFQPYASVIYGSNELPCVTNKFYATPTNNVNDNYDNFSNLGEGSYKIRMIDGHGCADSARIDLIRPQPLKVELTSTGTSCVPGNEGTITVNVAGGNPIGSANGFSCYGIQITPAACNPPQLILTCDKTNYGYCAGNYSVRVIDASGCVVSKQVTVSPPPPLTIFYLSHTNETCFNNCDAEITVIGTGGFKCPHSQTNACDYNIHVTPSYCNYYYYGDWNCISEKPHYKAGTYNVTLTDCKGCTASQSVVITEPPLFTISATATNALCNGGGGSITVSTTGGKIVCTDSATQSFPKFKIINGPPGLIYPFPDNVGTTSHIFSELNEGCYTIEAVDCNNCTTTINKCIGPDPPVLSASATSSDVTCPGGHNGSISIIVSGGSPCYTSPLVQPDDPSYSYLISPQPHNGISFHEFFYHDGMLRGNVFNDLSAGTYTITVTDCNGCTFTFTVTIAEPIITIQQDPASFSCSNYNEYTSSGFSVYGIDGSFEKPANFNIFPYCFQTSSSVPIQRGGFLPDRIWKVITRSCNDCCGADEDCSIYPEVQLINTISPAGNPPHGKRFISIPSFGNIVKVGVSAKFKVRTDCEQKIKICLDAAVWNKLNCSRYIDYPLNINHLWGTGVFEIEFFVKNHDGSCSNFATKRVTADEPYSISDVFRYDWNQVHWQKHYAEMILPAGAEEVIIKIFNVDAQNDLLFDNIQIFQSGCPFISYWSANNASCAITAGFPAQQIDNWSWGDTSLSFLWSNGATTSTISNLTPGTYYVTVTDADGDTYNDSIAITQQPLAVSITNINNLTCNGEYSGSANIAVTGGALPYSFLWSNGASTQNINNLSAGTYIVTVTDGMGCSASDIVIISESCITLNLRMLIEGYYIGAGTMQPVLYNAAQYSGLLPVPPMNFCDTIFVVLHDVNAVGPYDYPVIASAFAILKTNGNATVTLPASLSGGEYWIAIRNRTMVETWSALPVTISPITHYDFTSSASMAYFDNMKDMMDGNWAMYTGDIDDGTNTPFQDGVVDGSDFLTFDNQAQQSVQGYYISDLNGDGVVDGSDFLIFDVNAQLSIQRITPP